jgi:hypothetical protein
MELQTNVLKKKNKKLTKLMPLFKVAFFLYQTQKILKDYICTTNKRHFNERFT